MMRRFFERLFSRPRPSAKKLKPELAADFAPVGRKAPAPKNIPRLFIARQSRPRRIAYLGMRSFSDGPSLTRLTRTSLLDTLAAGENEIFVIDWASIRAAATQREVGEWSALWSVSDMRLNRVIMDACLLARGLRWDILVIGPVDRSWAPMFRTVSDAVRIIEEDEFTALPEALK